MSVVSCGIDFGTTNSTIAVAGHHQLPELVLLANNKYTIPSTVFYAVDKPFPFFGDEANEAYMNGIEGRFMRSLKRVLGTDLMNAGTIINGKSRKFEHILAQFIQSLKEQAENQIQTELKKVVMGRPVHFRDNDPKGDQKAEEELRNIAQMVGFEEIYFQFEPIAAAFAHEDKLEKEALACVVDVGGGTSDFTIIRLGKNLQHKTNRSDDILASSGVRIGGNDFDKDLSLKCFMPSFGFQTTYGKQNLNVPSSQYFELSEWSKVNSAYTYQNRKIVNEVLANAHRPELYERLKDILAKESGHKILAEVETAKINLTDNEENLTHLPYVIGKPEIRTTKKKFEQSIQKDIDKVAKSLQQCLNEAGVKAEQISLVILTGGSTEIPLIQQTMYNIFPQAVFSQENKLASVGLGLAFDSLRRFS